MLEEGRSVDVQDVDAQDDIPKTQEFAVERMDTTTLLAAYAVETSQS